MTLLRLLRTRFWRRRHATGGHLPGRVPPVLRAAWEMQGQPYRIPPRVTYHDYSGWVELSFYGPDRIVERNQRLGESFLEMTERLMEGEDL